MRKDIGLSEQTKIMYEVDIMERVKNPKLVHYYGFWKDEDGSMSVILDLCQGGDLNDLLYKNKSRKITMTERFEILKDIAEGIIGFHSLNMVHRDIKPLNVLFANQITNDLIPSGKLSDYGECYDLNSEIHRTIIKKMKEEDEDYDYFTTYNGTIQYAPPEILEGDLRYLSLKSDIYSFGMLMWEVFTETRPYENVKFDEITLSLKIVEENLRPNTIENIPYIKDTPQEIELLINKCLSQDQNDRPNIQSVLDDLIDIQEKNHFTNNHW